MYCRDERGYTLPELVVVMGIFLVIMLITSKSFERIVLQSSQQQKSIETQIEGVVGLEVLRADLENAGFGLPWEFAATTPAVSYQEAIGDSTIPASFWPVGTDSRTFNDSPSNAPRAILSGNTTFNKDDSNLGSQYLVIKSTLAVANDTSRKWTTIAYDKDGVRTRKVWGSTDRDFASADRVVMVKNNLMATPTSRQLVAKSSTVFSGQFSQYSSPPSAQNGDTYEIYGVNPTNDLRFPFNRADYYVTRPSTEMPLSCAPNTGILYKSTVIQGTGASAGGLTLGMPLLDCVADMQVVYGLDTDGSGRVNLHMNAPASTASPTAADIRSQLREVRVYILAQEGKRDRFYTYPAETVMVGESFGGTVLGRVFSLKDRIGPDYKNFRWKLYTIVVRPKNLIQ